jgi:RNA recognition motif-containing protein
VFKLFVARIPYLMTNRTLLQLFARFGEVTSATVSVADTGESLGCGYIEMEHQSEAQIAIKELNGSRIGKRNIAVSKAVTK